MRIRPARICAEMGVVQEIRELTPLLSSVLPGGAEIKLLSDEPNILIRGDCSQIQQIFINDFECRPGDGESAWRSYSAECAKSD